MAAFVLTAVAASSNAMPMRWSNINAMPMRWSNISVTIGKTQVVQGVSLEAHPGRLLGVLGPSGAGKTTILNILGGHSMHTPTGTSEGVPAGSEVAYLEQQEAFFGLLTVRETLLLAATLERTGSKAAGVAHEVDALLQRLGLTDVQHSRVGDASHRGISGGERRRLAVGCALLAEPALLVADEPTTGLDAHQAQRVVTLLRDTADSCGLPAVATLHQPRSSIWATLDDVLLLAPRGRVVYHGRRDAALAYFESTGHPCPPNTNPAEHLIDLVSVDHQSDAARALDNVRIDELAARWRTHAATVGCYYSGPLPSPPPAPSGWRRLFAPAVPDATPEHPTDTAGGVGDTPAPTVRPRRKRLGPLRRLGLLLRRSWRQNVRDAWANGLRLGVSGGLALVFGEIFGQMGAPTAASISERIALLSYASINMAMMALMKTLDLLGRERPVVRHEAARGHYGPGEYVLAKLIAELPLDATFAAGFGALLHWRVGLRLPPKVLIGTLAMSAASCAGLGLAVGALAQSPESALALGIPVMVVYMVLGIINPSGMAAAKPPSLGVRLVSDASPIKWSVRALVGSELKGMALDRGSVKDGARFGALALVKSGDEVLERLGVADTPRGCSKRLAQILLAELGVATAALWLTAPRYQPLKATDNSCTRR